MSKFGSQVLIATAACIAFVLTGGCGNGREAKNLPIGNVETPKPGDAFKGSVRVAGWALSDLGIDRVDVYWDDALAGRSKTGGARPDVQKVYPQYRDAATSGFDFPLDVSKLSPGTHELTVQVRSRDDAVRELYRSHQTITQ